MFKQALKAAIVAGAMLVPGVAAAATAAIVTTNLNIRSGPGTGYQAFASIPAGSRVTVFGCATGYNWCDIDWAGNRGWVSGNYLAYREGGGSYYDRPVSSVGVYVGVPVIGFDVYSYHDRYYRGRSWYRGHDRRDEWRDRPRYVDRDQRWDRNDRWDRDGRDRWRNDDRRVRDNDRRVRNDDRQVRDLNRQPRTRSDAEHLRLRDAGRVPWLPTENEVIYNQGR